MRSRWRAKQVRTHRYLEIEIGVLHVHVSAAVPENTSTGYLLIATSEGLNQQRIGITDAVVNTWILNAMLVVPELDHYSFWKDNSDFSDIFDVDWFISYQSKDVTVLKRIPYEVMTSMDKLPWTMRAPRKSMPEFYIDEFLASLATNKFDYRLTNELDEELQKSHCRVNFHALRLTNSIQSLGQKLVWKLRVMSSRYVAIHLRFEPDMLAFSGCYYGGGEKEWKELAEIRKRWDTYLNDTYLCFASGEIYGGEETLQPLRELFPNFYTREMLARDYLKPFLPFSSRLAAIDFIVCDESDVFVTNNNGNMAKVLAGHRRYMDHQRTTCPKVKKRNVLFQRQILEWVGIYFHGR